MMEGCFGSWALNVVVSVVGVGVSALKVLSSGDEIEIRGEGKGKRWQQQ
jgi:hypothetical protein